MHPRNNAILDRLASKQGANGELHCAGAAPVTRTSAVQSGHLPIAGLTGLSWHFMHQQGFFSSREETLQWLKFKKNPK